MMTWSEDVSGQGSEDIIFAPTAHIKKFVLH
jgi:hypothetical protein